MNQGFYRSPPGGGARKSMHSNKLDLSSRVSSSFFSSFPSPSLETHSGRGAVSASASQTGNDNKAIQCKWATGKLERQYSEAY